MKVSIIDCDSYDQKKVDKAIKKSLENINFKIKPNLKILIKPNILGQHPPEEHVTTHPAIVDSIVRLFKEAKCDVIIGESSGFYKEGGTMKALAISGMGKIADKYNIQLINLESKPIQQIEDKDAVIYSNPHISSVVFAADLVVNVPKLKTHTLMKYTGAVKNLFGTIPGGQKQKLHAFAQRPNKFGQVLVDIYQNIEPQLNIMDAIIGLEGNGPGSAGIPKKTGLIIASKSAPALDIVASEIIGYDPLEIYTNKYCIERGLVDKKDIKVIGKKKKIDYKKPIGTPNIPLPIISWFMEQAAMYPYVIKKKCVQCRICEKVCPMSAIDLTPYPKIDKSKCINCYCCHEMCPEGAMNLKGSQLFETIKKIKKLITRT